MKSIVVYFSKAGENSVKEKIVDLKVGNTEVLAKKIVKLTGSHIFKLEPVKPYSTNYSEVLQRAKEEQKVEYQHPEFKIDDYDVIFVGFPIWYMSYPKIISTFITSNQWVGKTVIPFCTNEEGSFGSAEIYLQSALKGAVIKKGFAERGYNVENCDERLSKWISEVFIK